MTILILLSRILVEEAGSSREAEGAEAVVDINNNIIINLRAVASGKGAKAKMRITKNGAEEAVEAEVGVAVEEVAVGIKVIIMKISVLSLISSPYQ